MDTIGVRELRQNASKYLARVAGGESLEVTDRGRPVARLVPVPDKPRSRYDEMVAAGHVIPAEPGSSLLDEPPVDYGINASEILAKMREDERY